MIYTPNGKVTKLYGPDSGLSKLVQAGYCPLGKFWPVKELNNVAQVSCGDTHSIILKTDGSLWVCGGNTFGELGIITPNGSQYTPNLQQLMTDVKYAFAGYYVSLIVKTDGTLWTCGLNNLGQLGAVKVNGGQTILNLTQVMTGVSWAVEGQNNTLILKEDGTAWTCGNNNFGQLGVAKPNGSPQTSNLTQVLSSVKSVEAGYNHSVFITEEGGLLTCGNNTKGQLGSVKYNGSNSASNLGSEIMSEVRSVSAGNGSTLILKEDNTLWTCGNNDYGQLATIKSNGSTTTSNLTQVMTEVKQVSSNNLSSLILKTDGSLWSCGYNYYGLLLEAKADGSPTVSNLSKVMTDVQSMSLGAGHCLVIKTDGSLWSSGNNNLGQCVVAKSSGSQTNTNTSQVF